MAVPEEGFKLNLGGHLLEDTGSGITRVFEHVGKKLEHGAKSSDMIVWDHERLAWGSIRDRYSGGKDELKKVISALMVTTYEELDRWDDRPLREWLRQHTRDQGVIDLWELLAVLECMAEQWYDHSASENLYVRKMHYEEARIAGYSFWPGQGWAGPVSRHARGGPCQQRARARDLAAHAAGARLRVHVQPVGDGPGSRAGLTVVEDILGRRLDGFGWRY